MKPIFPYYEIQGQLHHAYEAVWELPYLCEQCGLYRSGTCLRGQNIFQKCFRGLSVFHDKKNGRVYFGLKIKNHFNNSINAFFGIGGIMLQEKDIIYLLSLQDGCTSGDRWLADMKHDDGVYANALRAIKKISKGVDWEGSSSVIVADNRINEALAAMQYINVVRNQAKEIRNLIRTYCGAKRLPAHLNAIQPDIAEYFDCATRLEALISKWLHDESQYRLGLSTLLTQLNESESGVLSREDIHRIDAFRYAMKMLQLSSFSEHTETCVIGIHKIFQRYRYCFATPDVRLRLWRAQNKHFNHRLRVRLGFETVPLNLLDNAIKYLPKVRTHRSVVVSFSESDNTLFITVKSYGPLRTEEELKNIWDDGDRGDPHKVALYNVPGEGLGLTKVKKIVEEHGFKISATSAGKIVYSNGLPYRWFSIIIEIPLDCVLPDEEALCRI